MLKIYICYNVLFSKLRQKSQSGSVVAFLCGGILNLDKRVSLNVGVIAVHSFRPAVFFRHFCADMTDMFPLHSLLSTGERLTNYPCRRNKNVQICTQDH